MSTLWRHREMGFGQHSVSDIVMMNCFDDAINDSLTDSSM